MPARLPNSWKRSRLEDLVLFQKGRKPEKLSISPTEDSIPYLDIRAIEKNEIRNYADRESSVPAKENDLLIVWDGARSGWVGTLASGAVGSTIMKIVPVLVDSKYLYHFIRSNFGLLNTATKGTGIPHLNPEVVWNLSIPLPPLPEQERISATLDTLFESLDTIKSRLDDLPNLVAELRQQILDQAVTGKLSKVWRKRQRNGWKTVRLEEVCDSITDGDHRPPPQAATGIPFIVIGNVNTGYLDFSNTRFVPKKYYDSLNENKKPRPGDVLFTVTGSYGIAILVNTRKQFCFQRHIALLRPTRLVHSKYLLYSVRSKHVYDQASEYATGIAQLTVGIGSLRKIRINLPDLKEQQEIVKRVDYLFYELDKCERLYQRLRKTCDEMPQSILSKAYTGKLVPHNPNDEPAEGLLERIREEKVRMLEQRGELRTNAKKLKKFRRRMEIMEIIELLKKNKRMTAKDLWKQSKYRDDIDAFYAELKMLVNKQKRIKETKEGRTSYLELKS